MRTDRTSFCATCTARFPRAERCPGCGGSAVLDLRRAAHRRHALAALAKAGVRGPDDEGAAEHAAWSVARFGAPAAAVLVSVALLAQEGEGWVAIPGLALFAYAAVVFAAVVVVGLGHLLAVALGAVRGVLGATDEQARARRVGLLEAAAPGEVGGPVPSTVTGRVRAAEATTSPLAHVACVAFRVRGEGPIGPVDDAGGVPFEVTTDEGETVEVDLAHVAVDVAVVGEPAHVRPDGPLRAFLEERGVFPERGPTRLAEGVVREGDRLRLTAVVERVADREGYRGERVRRRLVGRPDAPVHLTRDQCVD